MEAKRRNSLRLGLSFPFLIPRCRQIPHMHRSLVTANAKGSSILPKRNAKDLRRVGAPSQLLDEMRRLSVPDADEGALGGGCSKHGSRRGGRESRESSGVGENDGDGGEGGGRGVVGERRMEGREARVEGRESYELDLTRLTAWESEKRGSFFCSESD